MNLIKIDEEMTKRLREWAEYFVELSVLVLPLQSFSSSVVGCSWILASRKVCI